VGAASRENRQDLAVDEHQILFAHRANPLDPDRPHVAAHTILADEERNSGCGSCEEPEKGMKGTLTIAYGRLSTDLAII
jgi:hypothetical protein